MRSAPSESLTWRRRANWAVALAGLEGGIVADKHLRVVGRDTAHVLKPCVRPTPAQTSRGRCCSIGTCEDRPCRGWIDDGLAVALVDQSRRARRQVAKGERQSGIDQQLRRLHRRKLRRGRLIVDDREQRAPTRRGGPSPGSAAGLHAMDVCAVHSSAARLSRRRLSRSGKLALGAGTRARGAQAGGPPLDWHES